MPESMTSTTKAIANEENVWKRYFACHNQDHTVHNMISSFLEAIDKAEANQMLKRRLITISIVLIVTFVLYALGIYFILRFAYESGRPIQSAAYIDSNDFDTSYDWSVNIINSPPKPPQYSSAIAAAAGQWPSSTYNPTNYLYGDSCSTSTTQETIAVSGLLTPNKLAYAVRVEIEPVSVSVQTSSSTTSDATLSLYLRVIIPQSFYNYSTIPATRNFDVSCTFFNTYVVSTDTLPLQSDVHYQYLKVPEFPLTEGSILFFPFDQYSSSGSVVCRYTNLTKCAGTCEIKNTTSNVCSCDTSTCSGLLNYELSVSQNFVGFFLSSSTVTKPTVDNQSFAYYNTESFTYETINIPSIKPAVVVVSIVRAPVNIVFPLYFALAMWVTVCANTGFSIEYFLGLRSVTSAGLAIGAISLLFALPSIRNTMDRHR